MSPTDGLFDSAIEAVERELDTTDLDVGQHLFFVRGQDANGVFGAISAQFLEILPAVLFADGFESGDTSAWDSTVP